MAGLLRRMVAGLVTACLLLAWWPPAHAGNPDDLEALERAIAKAFGAPTKLRAAPRDGDGTGFDRFGISIALSGNTALIGAEGDTLDDDASAQGSAYVFVRGGGGDWTLQAKLVAADHDLTDQFGGAVALDGDTALIGAIGANDGGGAAYVFVRQGNAWTQQQRLVLAAPGSADDFGVAVALSGNTALVGASQRDVGGNDAQGAAYVFVRSGSVWNQQAQLLATGGGAYDFFGEALALDGDTALVGDSRNEAAFVFGRSGNTWSVRQRLVASDAAGQQDAFGSRVALDGDLALVTAISRGEGAGAVYAFARSGANFIEQDILTASDGSVDALFGVGLALDGERALIGARDTGPFNGFAGQGTSYIFERSGGVWSERAILRVASGNGGDQFGNAMALDGDIALGGAAGTAIGANPNQGAVFEFVHTGGDTWTEASRIDSGNGAYEAKFGAAVALWDAWAVVGAPGEDVGDNASQGAAYVFARHGGDWTLDARLLGPDGAAGDGFGSAVAVSATQVLIGAPLRERGALVDHGAVYAYDRAGDSWVLESTLLPSSVEDQFDGGVLFGSALSLQGSRALIGAPGARNGGMFNSGAGYLFDRSTDWSQTARLAAIDPAPNDRTGASLALDGDTAILGAPDDDVDGRSDQGSALVFVRNGGSWTQQARLIAPDGAASDNAGTAVALSGDTALLGIPDATIGAAPEQGAVRVFRRSGNAWNAQQTLVASDGVDYDTFGTTLAFAGDTTLIGTDFVPEPVYVFERSGNTFAQTLRIDAIDNRINDRFGRAIALWSNIALIGAAGDDGEGRFGNPGEGSAYVYLDGAPPPVGRLFGDGFE
jgi:hypothetical protein